MTGNCPWFRLEFDTPADAPPLGMIRSLAYLLPVIEEVLESRVSPDYLAYLRHKLARMASVR